MENKGIVLKEKKQEGCVWGGKRQKSKEVATVENVDEVEKNDDLMKKLSIKDLNSDEWDFAFKDLTKSQLDSFCHALTKWELATSYRFAEELLGKSSTDEEKKKLTTDMFEYKISLLEEKLS